MEEKIGTKASYINKEQFDFLFESVLDINGMVSKHSADIDEIEMKLLKVSKLREQRKQAILLDQSVLMGGA